MISLRRTAVAVTAALLGVTLAACGSSTAADTTSAASTAGFPVTIKDKLGTAEIKTKPTRVVALSTVDIDVATALGVTPVGAWKSPYAKDGVAPWLTGKLDPSRVQLLDFVSTGVPVEKVLALHPDLILAVGAATIDQDYPALARSGVPVVTYQKSLLGDTFQDQTLEIGEALGLADKARRLVADTEAAIAKVKTDLPGLAGRTYTYSMARQANEIGTVIGKDNYTTQLFGQFGLKVAPSVASLPTNAFQGTASLSYEQIGLLDADLVLMGFLSPELKPAIESQPLFTGLKAVKDDHYQAIDLNVTLALLSPTVEDLPWVIGQLRPILTKVAT